MKSELKSITNTEIKVFKSNELELSAPFRWLYKGFEDFLSMPIISLFYGMAFMMAGTSLLLLIQFQGNHLIILPSLIIYMMLGPYLAVGLYYSSMQRERNVRFDIWDSMRSVLINGLQQSYLALILGLFMMFWTRAAAIIHALYPMVNEAPLSDYTAFLATGSVVGFMFLVLLFGMVAFSSPLIMDKSTDVFSAIMTSFSAVNNNKVVMIIWAFIITIFTLVGLLTNGYALILLMPIIGYGTWHGYRETIE